jgi:putative nucleotidyltransferase with HDIG domain
MITMISTHSSDVDREIVRVLQPLRDWDEMTWQHSLAVGQWSYHLASAVGLPPSSCTFAQRCGELHDIGKIFTPLEILRKCGPLSPLEWEIMRRHAADGAALLNDSPCLREFASTVLGHHERLDGSGYPAGTRGAHIPLITRIVAVADAFHAMIDNRTYQAPLLPSHALAELEAAGGRLWDPSVVMSLRAVLSGGRVTGEILCFLSTTRLRLRASPL